MPVWGTCEPFLGVIALLAAVLLSGEDAETAEDTTDWTEGEFLLTAAPEA
jgi:hypothetical protein